MCEVPRASALKSVGWDRHHIQHISSLIRIHHGSARRFGIGTLHRFQPQFDNGCAEA